MVLLFHNTKHMYIKTNKNEKIKHKRHTPCFCFPDLFAGLNGGLPLKDKSAQANETKWKYSRDE